MSTIPPPPGAPPPGAPPPATPPATPPPPGAARPVTFPVGAELPADRIAYGPDVIDESDLRLLGDISGRRVLQLGSHDGRTAIAMSRRGARVIAVEPSPERVAASRWSFDQSETRIELHQSDLADLAAIRADSIDLAVSIYSLSGVEDLPRVFRQVHRVLRQDAHFVFSLPHPAFSMIDPSSDEPMRIRRSYWDDTPRAWTSGDHTGTDHTHTISDLFTHLSRTNFRVDALLEPEPAPHGVRSGLWSETMRWVPATLVVRAKKQGI
jgi:SAM-dependent methyltransferase